MTAERLQSDPVLESRRKILSLLSIVLVAGTVAACQEPDALKQTSAAHGEGHGTPENWKFTLAQGDADAGRNLFVELECFKCHDVKGERFPDVASSEKGIGPELSQMAGAHPIEFFAESIANPNAVIDAKAEEQGYIGSDGKSKMPDFAEVLTVKQLTDLATYLASLDGAKTLERGGGHH